MTIFKQCRECGQVINPQCKSCGSYNVRDSDEPHEYYCFDCNDITCWYREKRK